MPSTADIERHFASEAETITHPNIAEFEQRRARERMSEAGAVGADITNRVAPTGAPPKIKAASPKSSLRKRASVAAR